MNLYIFDLDNTLLKVNCSFKYYSFLNTKKVFSYVEFFVAIKYLIEYLYFNLSPTELHQKVFQKFLKDKSFDQIFSYIEDFLDQYLKELINPKVQLILKKAQKLNERVVLLSNSPLVLAKAVGKRLNIDEVYGTTYTIDEAGKFISISKIMDGKEKAKNVACLSEGLDRKIVFTDSIWDRPLLEIADICYVVNPDIKLEVLAKANGWNFL